MENIISIKNLDFAYTKNKPQFTNLNLSIPNGSIYGFLGPNGAGKSTLIRLLLGLVKPKGGAIEILGKDLRNNKISILSKVGSLIEHPSLYSHLTGYQNLEIANRYKGSIDKNELIKLLTLVGLEHAKDDNVKSYSLGMKQRLGIAIAMVAEPELLILDEPINGLDPEGIKKIRSLLLNINKKYKTTIFISSHLLSEIENTCTHIAIINKGAVLYNGTIIDFKNEKLQNSKAKIEVDDVKTTTQILISKDLKHKLLDDKWLEFSFEEKNQVSKIIKTLVENNIRITQCVINNSLEKRYLELIKTNN